MTLHSLVKKNFLRIKFYLAWHLFFPIFNRKVQLAFKGKSVAVVGGAPSMATKNTGTMIDDHDVVVRINMPRNHDKDVFGCKTDYCFLGANVKSVNDERYLDEFLSSLEPDTKLLSTDKNLGHLSNVERFHSVHYYPAILPIKMVDILSSNFNCGSIKKMGGVPRSGLVCLALIYFFGCAKKITVFAMSDDPLSARQTIGKNGALIQYDEAKLLECHCSPENEIELMKCLINAASGKIQWVR
jgi:hypothetical protein